MAKSMTTTPTGAGRSDVERLVEQLTQVQGGGAWHGPSVAEALDGLRAAEAVARPIAGGHSIAEIVHHLRVTTDNVRRRLAGEGSGVEPDWPPPAEYGEAAWRKAVQDLQAAQGALRSAVSKLRPDRLHEDVPGQSHSYAHELQGLLHHDTYHAGQIALLRKGRGAQAALAAAQRAAAIPESADAYGWLVGSWDLDVLHYWTDVSGQGLRAEAHFGWILEGHAMQDVWIMSGRDGRASAGDPTRTMLGTTLRVWDAALQAWRVTWINPLTGQRNELVGRRVGSDVVQVGTHADGTPVRWLFTEITPDSFRWIGEALENDGRTWKVQGEFKATRSR
jgi:uncharacterized damage-inducible protein DinB